MRPRASSPAGIDPGSRQIGRATGVRGAVGRALGVLGLFTALSAWTLWPLVRHGADHILDAFRFYAPAGWLFAGDTWLYIWILAWVTHALTTAPLQLFDANIFYPAPWTLALSDHLLGYAPLFAPVYLATGNAVLAFTATLTLTFVLGGAAMYALVRRWTASAAAGVVAGVVFTFAPWRLSQLGHMQLLGVFALPLVLLFWDRALAHGRARDLAGLAAAFALQCLCAYYLAYCAVIATVLYAAITAVGAPPARIARAGAALGVAVALLVVVSLPYTWLRASGVIPEHGLGQIVGVGTWRAYVTWLPVGGGIRTYQGVAALAAAALGLLGLLGGRRMRPPGALRPAAIVALVAIGAAGVALAAGGRAGEGGLYGWLWRHVPGFSAVRVPSRFVILVNLAVAGLAGIGWALAVGRLRARTRGALSAAACALVLWDAGAGSLALPVTPVPTGETIPRAYRWLAAHGGGRPLLELPVRGAGVDLAGALREGRYAYFSTVHWLPQLTGRSGYVPPSHDLLMTLARRLPDPAALDRLVDLTGLGWIVVHAADLGPAAVAPWTSARLPGLEPVAAFGTDRIFRVTRVPDPDWRGELVARLRSGHEAATFEGAPLDDLAGADLRAAFPHLRLPRRVAPGTFVPVRLAVRNAGAATWPALAVRRERIALLRLWWRTAGGASVGPLLPELRFPADVPPGGRTTFTAALRAPRTAGRYELVAQVVQGGRTAGEGSRGVRALAVVAEAPAAP